MVLGSASRHAVSVALTWALVAASAAALLLFHDELGAMVPGAAGSPGPAVSVAKAEGPAEPERAGSVEIRAGRNGHFRTMAHLNGRGIEVMVDTGASLVALSYEDAQRAGVFVRPSDFTLRASTANGIARFAPVVLDSVSIGDIVVRDVQAAVSEPGRLDTSLLGMTFLRRLSRAELRRGLLVLEQ